MPKGTLKRAIYKLADYLIAFVLTNSGLTLLKIYPNIWPAGVSLIVVAFLILYFSSYTSQINKNEEEIRGLNEELTKLKTEWEIDKKLLNTLKDILLLKQVSKKK